MLQITRINQLPSASEFQCIVLNEIVSADLNLNCMYKKDCRQMIATMFVWLRVPLHVHGKNEYVLCTVHCTWERGETDRKSDALKDVLRYRRSCVAVTSSSEQTCESIQHREDRLYQFTFTYTTYLHCTLSHSINVARSHFASTDLFADTELTGFVVVARGYFHSLHLFLSLIWPELNGWLFLYCLFSLIALVFAWIAWVCVWLCLQSTTNNQRWKVHY